MSTKMTYYYDPLDDDTQIVFWYEVRSAIVRMLGPELSETNSFLLSRSNCVNEDTSSWRISRESWEAAIEDMARKRAVEGRREGTAEPTFAIRREVVE